MMRRGCKKNWTSVKCKDGRRRSFMMPIWTNRFSSPDGAPFNDKRYECAHCGKTIINDPPGQLAIHRCEQDENGATVYY